MNTIQYLNKVYKVIPDKGRNKTNIVDLSTYEVLTTLDAKLDNIRIEQFETHFDVYGESGIGGLQHQFIYRIYLWRDYTFKDNKLLSIKCL